jgi:putative ABC transport system substrate-binding protein
LRKWAGHRWDCGRGATSPKDLPRRHSVGGTAEDAAPLLRALTEALRDLGLVDGRNLMFESRYAGVRLERLPELAAELVRLRVDVIVTGSNPFVAAARRATLTIPIVFVAAADPVGAGFVVSLAKPGGNITGLTTDASPELFAKNLGLLTEIVPNLTRVGVLRQADRAAGGLAELHTAARRLNVVVEVVDVHDLDELASAFRTMTGKRVGAVIVFGSVFYLRRQELADLALKHRLPAIHVLKGYAEAGLLMSYGPNLLDLYRRAASYVAKILGGTLPADLPVEQPARLELVINLRTRESARADDPAVRAAARGRGPSVIRIASDRNRHWILLKKPPFADRRTRGVLAKPDGSQMDQDRRSATRQGSCVTTRDNGVRTRGRWSFSTNSLHSGHSSPRTE